jgi:hypothetical protein
MKNYKTTLIGAVLAACTALAIYQGNGGDLGDWKQWLIPTLIAGLGYVAKDAGVTGSVKALGLLLCLGSMMLTSCAGFVTAAGEWLASPGGQAVVAAVGTEAKRLEGTWEAGKIAEQIERAEGAIAKLPVRTGNAIKDLPRDVQERGWRDFIGLAQARYRALTGGKYVVPVVPVSPGSC